MDLRGKLLCLQLVMALVAGSLEASTSTGPAPEEQMGPPLPQGAQGVEQFSDWDDPVPWGGDAPPWFEDPASVDCGGRQACQAALDNETGAEAA